MCWEAYCSEEWWRLGVWQGGVWHGGIPKGAKRAEKGVQARIFPPEVEEVEFEFDPYQSDNPTIRAVFQDDLAQILWVAIKKDHLVSQHFNSQCLLLAKMLRTKKYRNMTGRQLNGWLSSLNIIGCEEKDVGDKLMPYIWGERVFKYVIKAGVGNAKM